MARLRFQSLLQVTPRRLFELHTHPGAFERLSPPWPAIRNVSTTGGFEAGAVVRIEMGIGPLPLVWIARYESVRDGESFVDVQDRGPFKSWRHEHRFIPDSRGCLMEDEVTFTLGRGLGLIDRLVVKPLLGVYFGMRHRALARWVREEAATPHLKTCASGGQIQ